MYSMLSAVPAQHGRRYVTQETIKSHSRNPGCFRESTFSFIRFKEGITAGAKTSKKYCHILSFNIKKTIKNNCEKENEKNETRYP